VWGNPWLAGSERTAERGARAAESIPAHRKKSAPEGIGFSFLKKPAAGGWAQKGQVSRIPSETSQRALPCGRGALITLLYCLVTHKRRIRRFGHSAVSEILCVDRVYLGSLFGISELIPKISHQIGWQIG
jgi:hypothetical protein